MTINSPLEEISKLTKPQTAALKKLGIESTQDLLLYFPFRYLDFSQTKKIKDLRPGENISLRAAINFIGSRFSFHSRLSLAEALVSDDTGSLKIVWFNQAYLAKNLKKGDEIFLAGTPENYKGKLQLTNPIYEKVSEFPVHTARLLPVYHLTSKLYPRTLRNLVAKALPSAKKLVEILPKIILDNHRLPDIAQTVRLSHFPKTHEDAETAKKRLAFEEIFINQLAAQKYKNELILKQAYKLPFKQILIKKFVNSLPFKLTPYQKKTAWEILQDLEKPAPMNRLLEGDVGSGKTLVALIAALQAVGKGLQAVLLAPTETLARQHFETACKYLFSPPIVLNSKCGLLTNTYTKLNKKDIDKKKLLKQISQGMPGLYIGTQALIQKQIKFKKLALVIIDEQHRFGVEQRSRLIKNLNKVPHLLSLTATPIPRTLQLAFYGELDVSRIKQKPAGRKTIITKLAGDDDRSKIYKFMALQMALGRQIFVITPLIEDSDALGTKAAKTEADNLKKIFAKNTIGLLHGRMKAKDKEQTMEQFLQKKIDILVSTSVVEVGVDVPNAGVMIIEGAERFGLAQLHQFRGRVGRAEHQSYCFLFFKSNNPDTKQRLENFTKTQDGFELAELDLKQRGFGELYGQNQAGFQFKFFDPKYTLLIAPARAEAKKLLQNDADLNNHPLLKTEVAKKTIHFE